VPFARVYDTPMLVDTEMGGPRGRRRRRADRHACARGAPVISILAKADIMPHGLTVAAGDVASAADTRRGRSRTASARAGICALQPSIHSHGRESALALDDFEPADAPECAPVAGRSTVVGGVCSHCVRLECSHLLAAGRARGPRR
jgi:hypothetical protein